MNKNTHFGEKIREREHTNKGNILCKCCPPGSSIHGVFKKGTGNNDMSPSLAPLNVSHRNTT